jgi:hypothetical protein
MTIQSYSPSILSIIVCSSFVLAYFYKLWPFWFVFAFFTLKMTLYWGANMAAKKRVEMTSSPYTFYLSWFNAILREFWTALSSVFHSMNRMLAGENYMPPPPMLSRSNTECYGEYRYSASLGQIHVSTYNKIRTCSYIAVMFCVVALVSYLVYCIW